MNRRGASPAIGATPVENGFGFAAKTSSPKNKTTLTKRQSAERLSAAVH
jgi:hypothetical protein